MHEFATVDVDSVFSVTHGWMRPKTNQTNKKSSKELPNQTKTKQTKNNNNNNNNKNTNKQTNKQKKNPVVWPR